MSEHPLNVLTDQNTSSSENQCDKNRLISEVDKDKKKLTIPGDSLPYIDWKDVGDSSRYGNVVAVAPPLFARLLYANPVCLLTTSSSGSATPHPRLNVMTISWLTPTTNSDGGVILSMNATRFSATLLKSTRRFVLNIPVLGMEDLVRSIGKCSGFDYQGNTISDPSSLSRSSSSKFDDLGIAVCRPGWREGNFGVNVLSDNFSTNNSSATGEEKQNILTDVTTTRKVKSKAPPRGFAAKKRKVEEALTITHNNLDTSDLKNDIAISSCVAHLICEVSNIIEPLEDALAIGTPLHLTIFANIKAAFVREKYWANGNFCPTEIRVPPYLTFFGGGAFGYSATKEQLKDEVVNVMQCYDN